MVNLRRTDSKQIAPVRFTFLLLDEFSQLSLSAAVETLRVANRASGRTLFEWSCISEDGRSVMSSQQMSTEVQRGLEDLDRDEILAVCSGLDVEEKSTPKVTSWIRRQSVLGLQIIGLCTASFTLAKAGLLSGKRATIHWENRDSFGEMFHDVQLSDAAYEIDGRISSTTGGVSSIDLFLVFVGKYGGKALADSTAERLMYSSIRDLQLGARVSRSDRTAMRHPKLRPVIDLMEKSIETPLGPNDLAAIVNISVRQLERLFRKYLGVTPQKYMMELRLDRAHQLLVQTRMSIIEIGIACGFSSPSHFSRCYRAHFNRSPLAMRR